MDTSRLKDGQDITKEEKKRMVRPMLVSSIIGTIIGIAGGKSKAAAILSVIRASRQDILVTEIAKV